MLPKRNGHGHGLERTPEQSVAHEMMDSMTRQAYGNFTFALKNNEGALLGPYAPLLYLFFPSIPNPLPISLPRQKLTLSS
jgi:hypothetical protein